MMRKGPFKKKTPSESSSNSLAPLIMSDISLHVNHPDPGDSSSGRGGSSSSSSSSIGNGSPSHISRTPTPHKKTPTRVFSKKKVVDMNPMPVPGEDRVRGYRSDGSATTAFQNGAECWDSGRNSSPQEADPHFPTRANDNNGDTYLTPSDPSPPASPTDSETFCGALPPARSRPFQRFDSGVGDCESDRGSFGPRFSTSPSVSSSTSMSNNNNNRLSTTYEQHYEDIDKYRKSQHIGRKTELPPPPVQQKKRGSTEKFNSPHHPTHSTLRPLPRVNMNVQGVTYLDNEDSESIVNTSIAETVSSPLNDPVLTPDPRTCSLPHMYSKLNVQYLPENKQSGKLRSSEHGRCCVVTTLLIIVFLISLVALALSIYVLVYKLDDQASTTTAATPLLPMATTVDMGLLVSELSDLRQEVESLKTENLKLKQQILFQEANLTVPLRQDVKQLFSMQSNLNQELQFLDDRLTSQVANISLTPGPQGKPGVANFSLCTRRDVSYSLPASPTDVTETRPLPSTEDIEKYFVTFAYCTFSGATEATLNTAPGSIDTKYRYYCTCKGTVYNVKYTVCTLVVWMCPRLQ